MIYHTRVGRYESIQGVSENKRYTAHTALSGEEDIRILAGEHVDVVFLGILMPDGMGGIETLRRMKQMSPDTAAQALGIVRHRPQMISERRLCGG